MIEDIIWASICTLSVVLGLCVGSFLNVVIYRTPLGMSLAKPDSHCPKCKYKLRWYDNIPVLSYLILGGKCRSCKEHISFRYTAVEILNAVLWLASVLIFWHKSVVVAITLALTFSVLICVAFIDLEHQIILDRFQLILLVLGVVMAIFDVHYGWLSHVLGAVAGFGVFYLVSWGFERITKKEGLGGGDVKLAGVMGLLLGWQKLLLGVLLACLSSVIVMLPLRRRALNEEDCTEKNSADEAEGAFPFGPFLAIGFAVAMLCGYQIINWYLSLLGL